MTSFPHLRGCVERLSPTAVGAGLCFHRSAALVLDLPGSELVMGTFRAATQYERETIPNASPVPFIHCWVEYGDDVIAPSLLEVRGLEPMDRQGYYVINGAHDLYRIARRYVRKMGLEDHLITGRPLPNGQSLANILLTFAQVPHNISPRGTVLPAQSINFKGKAHASQRQQVP